MRYRRLLRPLIYLCRRISSQKICTIKSYYVFYFKHLKALFLIIKKRKAHLLVPDQARSLLLPGIARLFLEFVAWSLPSSNEKYRRIRISANDE